MDNTEQTSVSSCAIDGTSLSSGSFTATLNGSAGERLGIDISASVDGQSWIVESVD